MKNNKINNVKILAELEERDGNPVLSSKVYINDEYGCSESSNIDLVDLIKRSRELVINTIPDMNNATYRTFIDSSLAENIMENVANSTRVSIISEIAKYSESMEESGRVLELTEEQKQYIEIGKKVLSQLLNKLKG